MIELLQGLLPVSHRGVRWVEMDTEIFLDAEEAALVKAGKDNVGAKLARLIPIETALRCVHSYTDPLPDDKLVFLPLPDDAAPGTRAAVNVDATLAALPASAWRKTGELELRTAGPLNLLKIFNRPQDFDQLSKWIGTQGSQSYPLDRTPRPLSVES